MDSRSRELYVLSEHNMEPLLLPVFPVVETKLKGSSTAFDEAVVLDLTEGSIHYFSSYLSGEPVYVSLDQPSSRDWKDIASEQKSLSKSKDKADTFILYHGTIKPNGADFDMYVAVAVSSFPKTVEVPKMSYKTVDIMCTVRAEHLFPDKKNGVSVEKDKKATQDLVEKEFQQLKATDPEKVYKEHVQAWKEIWKLGITLDSKDDPDIPSALHVNVTEYYLYSSSILLSNATKSTELQGRTGTCFYGPPTMHSAEFWVLPSEVRALVRFVENWKKALIQFGCSQLLNAGLFGFQEAIVLSFSGLQFTRHGLELAVNPISLQSNVSLRHLPYLHKELYLKIVINRVTNVKTVHVVSAGSKDPKLYACGAGCERITELSDKPVIFRAWLTSPVTPILYVSSNRSSLEEIKKSSFIKTAKARGESNRIPAFAAHHFKLSAKFWFAIAFLIIAFHVIVVKMICTEFRKDKGRRTRGKTYVS